MGRPLSAGQILREVVVADGQADLFHPDAGQEGSLVLALTRETLGLAAPAPLSRSLQDMLAEVASALGTEPVPATQVQEGRPVSALSEEAVPPALLSTGLSPVGEIDEVLPAFPPVAGTPDMPQWDASAPIPSVEPAGVGTIPWEPALVIAGWVTPVCASRPPLSGTGSRGRQSPKSPILDPRSQHPYPIEPAPCSGVPTSQGEDHHGERSLRELPTPGRDTPVPESGNRATTGQPRTRPTPDILSGLRHARPSFHFYGHGCLGGDNGSLRAGDVAW
jgi:hypothetical protein